MIRRPLAITVISWMFIVAGAVGLAYHLTEFQTERPFDPELLLICLLRLSAIVGGIFMLRGHDWARWILAAWLAYHVLLSALHTPFELLVHGLLFAAVAYFLFRP
jgi:hypothetical protein